RRVPVGEEEEVKPPDFIRAVVGTIARAHAAVIDHVIQAFGAVRGRAHRADQLARSVFALHARDRLEVRFGIIAVALVVGIHAEPVHVAAMIDLLFSDNRDVVLRLAGNDTVVAAHAGVEINRHAPRVIFAAVLLFVSWIERQLRRRLFFIEVRVLAVLLESRGAHDGPGHIARVHGLIALRGSQDIGSADLVYLCAGREPRGRTRAKRIYVKPSASTCAARPLAAIAQEYSDGVVRMPGLYPDGQIHLRAIYSHANHVALLHAYALRHRRANPYAIVPGDLAHRLGELLQPGIVGKTAVVDRRVVTEVDLNGFCVRSPGLREIRAFSRNLLGRIGSAGDQPIMQRAAPEHVEVRARMLLLPVALNNFVAAGLRLTGQHRQQVVQALAVIQRSNQGLD